MLIFVDRILPDGSHVLVPQMRPARAARTKHHHLYRCPNCGAFHLASK